MPEARPRRSPQSYQLKQQPSCYCDKDYLLIYGCQAVTDSLLICKTFKWGSVWLAGVVESVVAQMRCSGAGWLVAGHITNQGLEAF